MRALLYPGDGCWEEDAGVGDDALALFALEFALAELWRSWGVEPGMVLGDGVGEYVAACVAGVLGLEDALWLLCARERVVQARGQDGGEALAAFAACAEEVAYALPAAGIALVASLTGQVVVDGGEVGAQYWCRQVCEVPAQGVGVRALVDAGVSLFVEVGPEVMGGDGGGALGVDGGRVWVPSLRQGCDDVAQVCVCLAVLYVWGVAVRWRAFYAERDWRRVHLPTYPFQRRRYWVDDDDGGTLTSAFVPSAPVVVGGHPLLGRRLRLPLVQVVFEGVVRGARPLFPVDPQVVGALVLPSTAFVEVVVAAACEVFGSGVQVVTGLQVVGAMPLLVDRATVVQTVVMPGQSDAGRVEVFAEVAADGSWQRYAVGEVAREAQEGGQVPMSLGVLRQSCPVEVERVRLGELGGGWGGYGVQCVQRLWLGEGQALGEVVLPADMEYDAAMYRIHPALFDACFQLFAVAGGGVGACVLVEVQRLEVYAWGGVRGWGFVRLDGVADGVAEVCGDLMVFDGSEVLVARAQGVRLRRVGGDVLPDGLGVGDVASQRRPFVRVAELVRSLEAVAPHQRRRMIGEVIAGYVVGLLGSDSVQAVDVSAPLIAQGLDSLMVLELKRLLSQVLEFEIPVTLLFDYPSIDALAGYVEGRLFPVEDVPVVVPPLVAPEVLEDDALALLLAEIEGLSDAEASERLAQLSRRKVSPT